MKRFLLLTGITIGAAVGWLAFDPPAPREASANANLPPLVATGAPGEGSCFSCHSGALNDGVGSVAITGVPVPYMPGQTYALGVTVQRTGQQRWGFEITALKASDSSPAGTLASAAQLTDTTRTSGSGRMYVSHTTLKGVDGTFAGSTSGSWIFNWTAPAAGAGAVTFYAAGNAANGNGLNTGDFIYTTKITSMEGSATDVSATTWGKIKMLYR